MFRSFLKASVALACFIIPALGATQGGSFPERTVRLIVAYPPGGSTDTAARLVAEHLTSSLGQAVVVENKAGAGGTIGAAYVAKSTPDGYTLLFGSAAELSIASVTRSSLPFDTLRDFEPITLVGLVPFLLVTNPSVPAKNLKELIAWIKANPGKVNYSSFGNNTTNHMVGESFKAAAGVEAAHISYKGSAPSITDLLGGQVQYTFDTITATLPHVRSGGLRALAIALPERSALVPDVPTLSESGLPGFTGGTWFGILAPAGTPPVIVEKISREVAALLKSDAMRKEFADKGIEPGGLAPKEFGNFIKDESRRWKDLAARIDLKPQ